MAILNTNKSLSARIRRRNAQGFIGAGNHHRFTHNSGDYTDPEQNHKDIDYKLANRRKDRVNMKVVTAFSGRTYTLHAKVLNKKYADNHQKL